MRIGNSNRRSSVITEILVTALLGVLFAVNAAVTEQALQIANGVLAFIFMGAAFYEILKEEK